MVFLHHKLFLFNALQYSRQNLDKCSEIEVAQIFYFPTDRLTFPFAIGAELVITTS